MSFPELDLMRVIRALFREELRTSLAEGLRAELPKVAAKQEDDSGFLSIPHAAKYLDVSTKTIHRRIADGKLQSYGRGALVRVRKRDLLKVIDDQAAEIIDIEALAARLAEEE